MSGYDGIMMENVWHELKAIREGQEAMAYVPGKLDAIDDRLRNVESDVKAIKAVLTDHSQILKNHTRLHEKHSKDIAELRQAVV